MCPETGLSFEESDESRRGPVLETKLCCVATVQPALRAILKVEKHEQVLRSEADIEALELGEKTAAKVKEIVVTGQLARNEAFLADPKAQTLALVSICSGVTKK